MHVQRIWALIADGARARVVENNGHHNAWANIDGMVYSSDHSATHDLVTDSQGRTFGAQDPGRSALEPHSDPHRALKTRFAHHLAAILAQCLERKQFDHLIIAAPPAMLGELRQFISGKVRAKIVAEFAHDLTKVPMHQLTDHLAPIPPL